MLAGRSPLLLHSFHSFLLFSPSLVLLEDVVVHCITIIHTVAMFFHTSRCIAIVPPARCALGQFALPADQLGASAIPFHLEAAVWILTHVDVAFGELLLERLLWAFGIGQIPFAFMVGCLFKLPLPREEPL